MNRTAPAYATTRTPALPARPPAAGRAHRGERTAPVVRDLRQRAGRTPHALLFGPRDLVVVTGLPGSGKTTLMRRAARGARIDSEDTRDRWDARLAGPLPYALYRPLVRLAHYAALRRALRTGEGVVVHDCGTQAWVRAWLARTAHRRGGALHLLLLDVAPAAARCGQRERGRGVSRYAFWRHRRAAARLVAAVERGELPRGCDAAVLLDREAAAGLRRIGFTGPPGGGTR